MSADQSLESWLKSVRGKDLRSVSALFHVMGAKKDFSPQELGFCFDGSGFSKVSGGKDGLSLSWSDQPVQDCDLGEYGQLIACDVSSDLPYSAVVGHELKLAALAYSSADDVVLDFVLVFCNERLICVLNLGVEFFVYSEIPDSIAISEGLLFIPVR